MNLLSAAQVFGHQISLRTTDPRHIAGGAKSQAAGRADSAKGIEEDFGRLFVQALDRVNGLQVEAQDLSQALITDPESVDIHDVTIALAEANLALSLTKAIIDRAIRAYQTIVNIR